MHWPHTVACFFSGAFLANAVPHFVYGISGNRFPTPFAHPPGKGLSSPTVNTLWALVNIALGYALFRAGGLAGGTLAARLVFFAGIAAVALLGSSQFAHKHTS